MKAKVNYFYFGFLCIILGAIHLHHLFLIQSGEGESRVIFTVQILAQVILASSGLVILMGYLSLFSAKLSRLVMVLTFLFLSIHLIEFPLIRLMDITFWYGIDFVLDETWDNFIELLYASNITLKIWALSALAFTGLILAGIWLATYFEKWSQKKPLVLSLPGSTATFCMGIVSLWGWEVFTLHRVPLSIYEKCEKVLIWKSPFFLAPYPTVALQGRLKTCQTDTTFSETPLIAQKKEDIFLFVIESLREDYLDSVTAPHMAAFKADNNNRQLSYSNANATQLSWFSIFNAQYPFYWGQKPLKSEPALPIQFFKKLGYEIHLYSSSRLSFYQMKERLFGNLLDSCHEFYPTEERPIWQCDAELMSNLSQNVQGSSSENGRLFIIFLESTHFDYSWPKEKTVFFPVSDQIDYLQMALFPAKLDVLKNRYRNSIHHVDSLLGGFLQKISLESPVVITGDHGEEFFEDGHLFHASNLNEVQTRVPIYYRLANKENRLTSHIDIFPTLLHYVAGEDYFSHCMDGHSLLAPLSNPFVIAARYNASRPPNEFFIHDGKRKIRLRFDSKAHIQQSECLEVLSPTDLSGEEIQNQFGSVLTHLFSSH